MPSSQWPAPRLPYCVSCLEAHPRLYPLSDGRFQIMEEGALAPLMIGYEYVLVESALAEYLAALDLPDLSISEAVLYDARRQLEVRTHRQLHVGQQFSADEIRDIEMDGERLLLMDDDSLFASPALQRRLELSPFKYLRFTEGLDEFAGDMKQTLSVTVQEGETISARSRQELAELLAAAGQLAKSRDMLAIVTLESEAGATLSIVVGGEETVLAFDGSFDPPYFASKGASDEKEPYLECYLHFDHHTEISRDHVVPFSVGEQAAYEFLETGVRPECVQWQEV